MLRDIVDDWKNSGRDCETVTIYCPYCHQGMAAEATPDMARNDELLEELAVETCSCQAAQESAKRKGARKASKQKLTRCLGKIPGLLLILRYATRSR